METKTKSFDAVAESRKWRDSTSRKLDSMSIKERLTHLQKVRSGFVTRQKTLREKVLATH
jgi:hypothetical protein